MIKKENFNFIFDENACNSCGAKCCTGESGFIWINEAEIAALANLLKISKTELKERYLYRIDGRFSVIEKPFNGGFACVFFDEVNKNCSVYAARPKQCRTFPFWDRYKGLDADLKALCEECEGVRILKNSKKQAK